MTVDLSAIPLEEYLAAQPGAAVLVRGVWTEGGVLVADSFGALPGVPGLRSAKSSEDACARVGGHSVLSATR